MGLLNGDALSGIFTAGFSWLYADAIYTVDEPVAGGSEWNPAPPVPRPYPCKAQRDEWSAYERQGGQVGATDWKILILVKSLAVPPVEGGRITINGLTLTIASAGGSAPAVSSDPAGAAWVCRCRV